MGSTNFARGMEHFPTTFVFRNVILLFVWIVCSPFKSVKGLTRDWHETSCPRRCPMSTTIRGASAASKPFGLGISNEEEANNIPHLTVIIPAYNEELRIGETLESYYSYLQSSKAWRDNTLILVADDGSLDATSQVVGNFKASKSDNHIAVECISLPSNQGKGAALAFGIDHVCQAYPSSLILTTDADNSAPVEGLGTMYNQVENELARLGKLGAWDTPIMISGYRSYESASAARLVFRWGFRTIVKTICGDLGISDSHCGFKLMTTSAAQLLYGDLNLKGWSHDVEVFFRAKQLNVPVVEQPIRWKDKDGSKLVSSPGGILAVCLKMLFDVIQMRWKYETGQWRTEAPVR